MRLLMVAPPGAGKGTQATRLAAHYGIAHLSSGDLFRREVADGTPIGREAAAYLARGDLVPDRLVLDMLGPPVLEAAARGGYVLDGYPRTRAQAEEAYDVAHRIDGVELQAVVHLQVRRDELLRRLLARAEEDGRVDDNETVIQHRLAVYDSETAPMLEFYAERGLVVDIDGEQSIEDVFSAIIGAVDAVRAGLS
ncbi:MAG TPA: adenylate kinase [Acidimicrobiales bacterium]|jgi:adenylate kinase|nr:adenylate kinase [Acidimicrobiales bacterium]